ncbi:MAG: DUF2220 family protein [Marinagarivorans sp.]|nr:DUF2220 family protein [Marinagarivorans sp.]
MLKVFDPITQQLIQSLINLVNRSNGVTNHVRLPISSQFASSYVNASQANRRICHQALQPLHDRGLIECAWHLKVLEDFETLKHINIADGRAFLRYLGIAPQVEMVANASTTLDQLKCGIDWIDQKISQIGERWRLGARYLQLGPEHINDVVVAATLARHLATEPLSGRNIRALSLDWFGAANTIVEHQQIITLFCESQIHALAKDLDYSDQMASLGLSAGSALLHLRGPIEAICDDEKLINLNGWCGVALASEFIRGFERTAVPCYLLTIEDYTLYQRYIANVHDGGIVLFTGDFPSAQALGFYKKLLNLVPANTPLYHWGNIDLAGFKAILALQQAAMTRSVNPFQMGAEQILQASSGVPIELTKLRRLVFLCKNALRDTLIEIASLPAEQIKECSSEGMPVVAPPALDVASS